ncbi:hypothetical protein DNU06_00820 [Putridiphycobacter roseus]|uniref:Secretion system C-terminal sorting domain-containing protein n=1 Tax=Putridiphycobacter roseus TaxID=2219161 RepID=A0A2W1N489_9FLAO|nr:T9SS type A sorting domain-containing protein [Putridiphycobacter roseus]PZE18410.1 hypothetical protein DNU06_00820 [Putridiphycobacter roseus]
MMNIFNNLSFGKTVLSIFTLCGLSNTTIAQTFEWANQIEGTGIEYGLSLSSLGADVYSTGYFEDTIDLDPSSGVHQLTNTGGRDVYIQKLDDNGNFVWGKKIGGTGDDIGRVINDYGTTIIISGTFSDTVDFDPGMGTEIRSSNGAADLFILALDNNGDFLWVKTFGGTEMESFGDQELDLAGAVVITGGFSESITLDVAGAPMTITSVNPSSDVFVAKMALSNGNISWIKTMGGTGADNGTTLVTKSDNNIVVAGRFHNIMEANPGTGTFSLNSAGNGNVFIIELNELGDFVHAFSFDNSDNMEIYDMDIDSDDNIYLTGPFKATTDFDLKSGITSITSNGGQDCYLVKLTSLKDLVWVKTFGAGGLEQSFGVQVGNDGDVYTIGRFKGTVDFDPGAGAYNITAFNNTQDMFFQKLDSLGEFQWAYSFGDLGTDIARGLEFDNEGNIFFTGGFGANADFDPTAGTTLLTATGAIDPFIIKFSTVANAGIKDLGENSAIKLYPNPVQNLLNIELPEEKIKQVAVYSISGQLVKPIFINNNTIDVSALKAGIYILTIKTETAVYTNRFVKQ